MTPVALDVGIKFTRPQFQAFNTLGRGRTVFLGWGRGTGKSHFLRTVCWLRIAEWDGKLRTNAMQPFRGLRIVWLMPSRKQFVDVHGAAIRDELGPGGKFGFLGGKINGTTWEIDFPGGSTLIPFPASDYNSQAARGARADLVIVDECDDVNAEVYNSVAVPWLSGTWSLGEELLAGTPTRGRHGLWFRMREMGRRGARIRSGEEPDAEAATAKALSSMYASHATYADSPEVVRPEAVAKAKATTPMATFEREWEANPDAGEGLVYPFDDKFHIRVPPEGTRFSEHIVGVDHGWTDAGVFLLIGITGHGADATAWILQEIYETEKPGSWWDEQARRFQGAQFWCDPSRPDRIKDLQQRGMVNARGSDNDIASGVARVADLLFRRKTETGEFARLYVHPSCANTIREFGLYRRKKHADGTFSEAIEDRNNHAMDAGRYALVMRFGRLANGKSVVSGA